MRTNKTNEIKRIYSKAIALDLRKRGFKIIRTEPNEKYPQFDVYVFDNTNGILNTTLTEIMGSRSNYVKIK